MKDYKYLVDKPKNNFKDLFLDFIGATLLAGFLIVLWSIACIL